MDLDFTLCEIWVHHTRGELLMLMPLPSVRLGFNLVAFIELSPPAAMATEEPLLQSSPEATKRSTSSALHR